MICIHHCMVGDLLSVQMLEDTLDPVATEGSFTFVATLVGDGDLHDI